jgi:Flp pilus assembly protein TadD
MPLVRILVVAILACSITTVLAQSDRSTPEQIFAAAVKLHQDGDTEGAIKKYREFLVSGPDNLLVRSNLGAALARLGRYEEAVKEYDKALEFDPGNQTVRYNLALAYYKSTDIPRAAVEFSKIVAAMPDNRNALMLLADCHLQLGENKKTIDLLSPLQSSSPHDAALNYLLGSAYIRDQQIEKGQILLDRILRQGESAEAHLMLGTAQFMAHDYPNALKELKSAVELNAKLPMANSYYGRALLATGDREAARKAFLDELELSPIDFDANLSLGIILKEEQKYDEAAAYLGKALLVRPRDSNARYFLAGVRVAEGKIAEAEQILKQLVKDAPDFVEAHVILATIYYRLKRKDEGDRERATVQKLTAERQAAAPGAQEGLGPAYRGELVQKPQQQSKPGAPPQEKKP